MSDPLSVTARIVAGPYSSAGSPAVIWATSEAGMALPL